MSETVTQPDQADVEPQSHCEATPPQPRRSKVRRLGCGLALMLWFILLVTPCALFYLAANGEIRLEHGDIPQPHAHPLLLISLVSETEDRGLRFETSWMANASSDEGMQCVQTAVRFLLWEYSGGSQNVSFCDCYQREEADSDWEFVTTYGDAC